MKAERDIERKIKQKEEEVQRLREELVKAEAFIEAWQESLRLIKKDSNTENGNGIRPGSMIHKAQTILRQEGKPLYVGELLKRMGREVTKRNRMSLSGSLGSYVRNKQVFTRPAPNTFGLMEFGNSESASDQDELPDEFGN
jgi:predicted RNase H-like nuclease (RuvC/YqgF family)